MTTSTLPAGSARKRRPAAAVDDLHPELRRLGLGIAVHLVQPAGADPARRGRRRPPRPAGWDGFVDTSPTRRRWPRSSSPSVRSLLVTVVNVVMGTVIAWVLVRDRFWGKRVLDVVIDIPFALPTIVAGLVLLVALRAREPARRRLANTANGGLPGAGVRDAAVHRAHGAAGARGARADVEEAAASLGAEPADDLPPDHPAQPGPGDRGRRRAVVRPGDQRVRLAGAAQRQPAATAPRWSRCGC